MEMVRTTYRIEGHSEWSALLDFLGLLGIVDNGLMVLLSQKKPSARLASEDCA